MAGAVGTLGTRIAGVEVKTALTTPEAPDLHALFAVMRERGVEACAMEVSSHALVMGRVDGVVFDVAVFTNLGRDHLDFHADVEDYFRAKASLFTPGRSRLGLVNVDDEHGRRLVEEADGSGAHLLRDRSARPTGGRSRSTSRPTARRSWWSPPTAAATPPAYPLPGAFNVANALAAVAACGEAGLDPQASPRASPAVRAYPDGSSGWTPGRTSPSSSTTPTSRTRWRPHSARCARSPTVA